VHGWEITPDAVYTRSGWIDQEWRIAPVSRIQTVDSERGVLQRLFRLSDLTVTTASSAGALKIHGLDVEVAQRAADELTGNAVASEGDAT
jgi:membrane protein YdbS with pleckstrin-like domain